MPPPAPLAIHRPLHFALGMGLLLIVGGVFVIPSVAPQPTCDAFGALMACPDGSTPRCASVPVPGDTRHQKELSIRCKQAPRSSAPIYVAAGLVSLAAAAVALPLILKGLKPPPA